MRQPLPAALHQRPGEIPGFIYAHARQCVAEGGVCTHAGGGRAAAAAVELVLVRAAGGVKRCVLTRVLTRS